LSYKITAFLGALEINSIPKRGYFTARIYKKERKFSLRFAESVLIPFRAITAAIFLFEHIAA
jgi:hypothetical protein